MFERGILPAVDPRQLGLLRQDVLQATPPRAMPVSQEAVVKDRVEPTTHVSVGPPQVPARKRAFQRVLHEIVGTLRVTAQQRAGETAQPGNLRFDQSGSVWDRLTVKQTATG